MGPDWDLALSGQGEEPVRYGRRMNLSKDGADVPSVWLEGLNEWGDKGYDPLLVALPGYSATGILPVELCVFLA